MADATLVGTAIFAATSGVATFFAPCAFPLLPGYIGYYMSESDGSDSMLPAAGAAAVGALGAMAVVAALALAIGQSLKQALPVLEPVIGVGLVVFGVLVFLGRGPELRVNLPDRTGSTLGFGVFGAVYAVAAAGCVVPVFLGVLSQALALPPASSVAVLGVYALGLTLPLVGVTLLAGVGVDAWKGIGRYTRQIQRVAAVVMVLAGLGQVYLSIFVLGVI